MAEITEYKSSLTEFAARTAQNNYLLFNTFGMYLTDTFDGYLDTLDDSYYDKIHTRRESGIQVRRIGFDVSRVAYTMTEFIEECVVSERVAMNADPALTTEEVAVTRCVDRIMRKLHVELASVLIISGNYTHTSSDSWATTSAIDSVRKQINAIVNKKGIRPDTLILDSTAYNGLYKIKSDAVSVDYPLSEQLGVARIIPFDTRLQLNQPMFTKKAVLACVGDITDPEPVNKFMVPLVQREVNFATTTYFDPSINANVVKVKLNAAIVVADKDLAALFTGTWSTDPFA